jgi:hypothetical protein
MTRNRAEEYRRLAQECLTAARTVSTEEARTALIERAKLWFRLAEEQDDEGAAIQGSVPPIAAEESQSAAQQQQQIQPKDDDTKE